VEAVFVYGTLKKGHKNHHYLAPAQGWAAKMEGLSLHLGPGYPYACLGSGSLEGEVYFVSLEQLERLDQLEEAPHYYQRVLRPVWTEPLGWFSAWVYLRNEAQALPLLQTGVWTLAEESQKREKN